MITVLSPTIAIRVEPSHANRIIYRHPMVHLSIYATYFQALLPASKIMRHVTKVDHPRSNS